MTEDQIAKSEAEAAQISAKAFQMFWRTCMDNIVQGGASEREASMHMLTVAAAYVARACGDESAVQLLTDHAMFFARAAKAKDEAVAEAPNAQKH